MEEKSRAVRSVESEETFNDYEFSPVPDEKKNTWKAQVFVWLGVGFCLTAFTLGGQIALGLGFWPTVAAVLVGGIILTVVGALVGAIGVRSGLSSTVSSRFTFGTYGAIIFGLINALCNFGWFGSFCWASAAVRCLGEFAQKMKWKAICEPVEMKQGFSPAWHEACHALAARIAGDMDR